MKLKISLFIGFILFSYAIFSQTYSWPVGTNKDSSNSWIAIDSLGEIKFNTIESWTPISSTLTVFTDTRNEKLFSNGCGIFDYNGQLIENGDKLNDGALANIVCNETGYIVPNGALLIQYPGTKDSILLIHLKATIDPDLILKYNSLLYTLIVKNPQNNYEVTQKNIPLLEGNFDNFQVVRHANGRDFWIYLQDQAKLYYHLFIGNTNGIYIYKKDQKLIGPEDIDISSHSLSIISNNGNLLSVYNPTFGLLIYRFDRCAGSFNFMGSNSSITNNYRISDLAYSLNDSLLFISAGRTIYTIKIYRIGIDINPSIRHVMPYGCLAYRLHTLIDGNILISDIHSKSVYHLIKQQGNDSFSVIRNKYELVRHQLHTIPVVFNEDLKTIKGSLCDTIKIPTSVNDIKEISNLEFKTRNGSVTISSYDCNINNVQICSIDGKIISDDKFQNNKVVEIDLQNQIDNNKILFVKVLCDKFMKTFKIIY